jgi:sugar phosphate isomerase/epimerase
MNPILALSTAWSSPRHSDGYAMLREMADLGFEYVELSHGIRIVLVPGVLRALNEGFIKASSAHNFCPLPTGLVHPAPNLFEPSVGLGHEHDQWLRHTRRTVDFAAQVRARAVVLHLGSVRFFWSNPGRKLRHYLRNHPAADLAADAAYQRMLAKGTAKLRRRMPPFWAQTRLSLEEILPYAAEKGVRLGLENREKFEELPADADLPELFKTLAPAGPAGYWHDTGHAELKERMGVITQQRQLEANAEYLIGFHLHDVDAGGHDHQPIGQGRVDFRMVRRFWQPHHLLVLELNPRVTPAEVRESKERIEDLLA